MGRKIPAKRHRGVKNPLEQQARREKSLKCKINAPPKDPDDQPVPRSLTRLFHFQQNKQHGQQNTRKNNRRLKDSKVREAECDNPVSALRRLPGESGRSFSLRINSAVRVLHGHLAPAHCPEEMEAEDVKGERMAARRERKRRRAAAAPPRDTLTRTQKLALKKKAKKEKADDLKAMEGREVRHEHVPFGEVAHGPPAWRAAAAAADRPARRPLLLAALLAVPPLPPAGEPARAQREAARQHAVDAYRQLKRERNGTKPR